MLSYFDEAVGECPGPTGRAGEATARTPPADVVRPGDLEASESAEMLVVGRGPHESDLPILGSQVRRLINTARCPVVVAAPIRTGVEHRPDPPRSIREGLPRL
jgi:hypothetical protein